ncbi:hypothetical protein FOFC_06386 [Fusarium oxysporum]|nr:hypothetical protein FOFC_06386 [Fusarium oxysporum]
MPFHTLLLPGIMAMIGHAKKPKKKKKTLTPSTPMATLQPSAAEQATNSDTTPASPSPTRHGKNLTASPTLAVPHPAPIPTWNSR